jgi:hypothetical protein
MQQRLMTKPSTTCLFNFLSLKLTWRPEMDGEEYFWMGVGAALAAILIYSL